MNTKFQIGYSEIQKTQEQEDDFQTLRYDFEQSKKHETQQFCKDRYIYVPKVGCM